MTALLDVEARRYLARRLTRILVLLALAGIALGALLAYANASDAPGEQPRLVELWRSAEGDPGILAGFALVWVLIAFVVGASFIGAEWRAGTVTTLLTWEPRRLRVFAAKTAVAGGRGGALVVALDVTLGLALVPTFVLRGSTAGAGRDFWLGAAGDLLRGGVAGVLLALIGFAVASLGRNTTAALAGVLAYLVVAENVLRGLRPGWSRWLVLDNLLVLVGGGSGAVDAEFARSALGAGLLLAVYVAGAWALAAWAFVRRDVT